MFKEPPPEALGRIPRLYCTEGQRAEEKIIRGHFFLGPYDWYVAEFDGEDLFFGFVNLNDPDMAEWGYFSLSELRQLSGTVRLVDAATGKPIARGSVPVEWDEHWHPRPFRDVAWARLRQGFGGQGRRP